MKSKNDYIIIPGLTDELFSQNVIIWGNGMGAVRRYMEICEYGNKMTEKVLGFTCTGNNINQNKLFCGKKFYSLQEIKNMKNIHILVSTYIKKYIKEIIEYIHSMEIEVPIYVFTSPEVKSYNIQKLYENREKLEQIYSTLEDEKSKEVFKRLLEYRVYGNFEQIDQITEGGKQYFPDFLPLTGNETFVDCGGYYGDTTLDFIEAVHGRYNKILAFEPDSELYEVFKTIIDIKMIDNIELYKAGVYDRSASMSFIDSHNSASKIIKADDVDGTVIKTVSLDDMYYGKEPIITYAKMDIEGAEKMALIGMKKIIQKDKPKLAICCYHLEEDLWEIPMQILSMNKQYKLYMRHYGKNSVYDTICFAL